MYEKSTQREKVRGEKRNNFAVFFGAMFKTFGFTLLLFLGLIFVIFIIMWILS